MLAVLRNQQVSAVQSVRLIALLWQSRDRYMALEVSGVFGTTGMFGMQRGRSVFRGCPHRRCTCRTKNGTQAACGNRWVEPLRAGHGKPFPRCSRYMPRADGSSTWFLYHSHHLSKPKFGMFSAENLRLSNPIVSSPSQGGGKPNMWPKQESGYTSEHEEAEGVAILVLTGKVRPLATSHSLSRC